MLAEETNSGRTGRSVDSSLERMQLKVTGLDGGFALRGGVQRAPCASGADRHRMERQSRGYGIGRAGFRRRCTRPFPVHTPLVFDLIDTWKSRSVARCTYFAGPPDGTVHTTRPREMRRRLEDAGYSGFRCPSHHPSRCQKPEEEKEPGLPDDARPAVPEAGN